MSERTVFYQRAVTPASAAETILLLLGPAVLSQLRELWSYVVFGPGTLSGVVTIEGAHDPNFTGIWASIATVTWAAAANKAYYNAITGGHNAVRFRISTVVVGGTADVFAGGN